MLSEIGVRFQNSAQMRLAQDNDVVGTFTPDRSDQPFGKSILPGRRWCNGPIPDAHGTQSAHGDAAIDPIAIADHVARRFIPRESFCDLACNPFCRLGDLKLQLEQFAVNAWRAPKWVLDAHAPDQYAQLRLDWRPPSPSTRFPTPVAPKAGPVPTHERIGPDDCENLQD